MAQLNWIYDELVLATDLVARHGWNGLRVHNAEVIELSQLLRSASFHEFDGRPGSFRSPNSVQRKTFDIATQHPDYKGVPTRGGHLDSQVLRQFIAAPRRMADLAASIREQITAEVASDLDLAELAAHEGRVLAALHLRRERSAALRAQKIAAARAAGAAIACEVCWFDFARHYGDLGQDYIEVHHILPLHASGPVMTRLEDLALLCSNCHRMIHRARPWLTPKELGRRYAAS